MSSKNNHNEVLISKNIIKWKCLAYNIYFISSEEYFFQLFYQKIKLFVCFQMKNKQQHDKFHLFQISEQFSHAWLDFCNPW